MVSSLEILDEKNSKNCQANFLNLIISKLGKHVVLLPVNCFRYIIE